MGCGWEVDGGGKTLHVLSVGAPGRPNDTRVDTTITLLFVLGCDTNMAMVGG